MNSDTDGRYYQIVKPIKDTDTGYLRSAQLGLLAIPIYEVPYLDGASIHYGPTFKKSSIEKIDYSLVLTRPIQQVQAQTSDVTTLFVILRKGVSQESLLSLDYQFSANALLFSQIDAFDPASPLSVKNSFLMKDTPLFPSDRIYLITKSDPNLLVRLAGLIKIKEYIQE